eukprot:3552595-Rhodomonas_salina.1
MLPPLRALLSVPSCPFAPFLSSPSLLPLPSPSPASVPASDASPSRASSMPARRACAASVPVPPLGPPSGVPAVPSGAGAR